MKTFYLGCKINTNIPNEELFFAIKVYNSNTKKYILDMKPIKLSSSHEAYQVFIYQTSVDQARKHQVWLYIYRSWHSSEYKLIAYRNIGSLAAFDKPGNFKNLTYQLFDLLFHVEIFLLPLNIHLKVLRIRLEKVKLKRNLQRESMEKLTLTKKEHLYVVLLHTFIVY